MLCQFHLLGISFKDLKQSLCFAVAAVTLIPNPVTSFVYQISYKLKIYEQIYSNKRLQCATVISFISNTHLGAAESSS